MERTKRTTCLFCGLPLTPNAVLGWGGVCGCQAKMRRLFAKTWQQCLDRDAYLKLSLKIVDHHFELREQEDKRARQRHQKRPHARSRPARARLRIAA